MPMSIYGYLGILRQDGGVGSLYPVRSVDCTVGRNSDCSVRIHQEYLSDKQCVIRSHNDTESTIQNLSPTSCTLLNGESLYEEVAVLHHGDVITMVGRRLLWEYPKSSKFWSSKMCLKISPTKLTTKKTASLPSTSNTSKISSTRTTPLQILPTSSSAEKCLQTGLLKKSASQGRLSLPSTSGFKVDWATMTPPLKNGAVKKRSRAASLNLTTETSKKLEFPIEVPKPKSSGFKTLAPSMLASLQQKVSGIGLEDLDNGAISKFSRTVYGQLAILRPDGSVGSRLPLSTEACTIGRSLDCNIRIALSTVSQKQCLISSQKNEESTIRNLSKSSNTLVNGKKIGEEATRLCHGDIIEMSERRFVWEYPLSSLFWKKLKPNKKVCDKQPTRCQENNSQINSRAVVSSKSLNQSVATDRHKVASTSKSSPVKGSSFKTVVPNTVVSQLTKEPRKKAVRNFSSLLLQTSLKNAASSSPELSPEQLAMNHGTRLKPTSTLKRNGIKSLPFPFLKSMPELSKNNTSSPKVTPWKGSSFNAPIPSIKAFSTRKLSDKKVSRTASSKPTPVCVKKTVSSPSRLDRGRSPQRFLSTGSSCEGTLSPRPPTEGPEEKSARTSVKINSSLFKGCCFTTTNTKLREAQSHVSPEPTLPKSARSVQDDEEIEFPSTIGLIDPIYL